MKRGQHISHRLVYWAALTLFACGAQLAAAQSVFTRTYGGKSFDIGKTICRLQEGGFVLAGRTESFSSSIDLLLVRTDEAGGTVWQKHFGDEETEEAFDVIQTKNGNILVVGTSDSYGAGPGINDMWAVMVDRNGTELWKKTYGSEMSVDVAKSVVETEDGGFLIVGNSLTIMPNALPSDIIAVKINAQGGVVWEKRYGGTSNEEAADVIRTPEGFAILGSTESAGKGSWDVWLASIDKQGKLLWEKTYGGGDVDMGNGLIQTKDGGYAIAGHTYSFSQGSSDIWAVRTDAKGTQLWAKTFGALGADEAYSILETAEGNLLAAGYTETWQANQDGDNISKDGPNVYLILINPKGEKVWEKSIGGERDQRAYDAVETADKGFAIVGFAEGTAERSMDLLLLKVSAQGDSSYPR